MADKKDDDAGMGLIMVFWLGLVALKLAGGLPEVPWWVVIISLPLMYLAFFALLVGGFELLKIVGG